MNMKKINVKPLCIGALICAFVYGLVLPFCWGNNPASEFGTLSLLCEDRKGYFWVWGLLTAGAIVMNAQYMYRKFNMKSRFFDVLCALSIVSVSLVALTLGHSIADWNPKRIAHWVATGCFIVFLVASIALFFIINRKKHPKFNMLTVCTLLIFATFVVIFAVLGKSALMEMIPIALFEIFLFAVNFTPWIKAEEKQEELIN